MAFFSDPQNHYFKTYTRLETSPINFLFLTKSRKRGCHFGILFPHSPPPIYQTRRELLTIPLPPPPPQQSKQHLPFPRVPFLPVPLKAKLIQPNTEAAKTQSAIPPVPISQNVLRRSTHEEKQSALKIRKRPRKGAHYQLKRALASSKTGSLYQKQGERSRDLTEDMIAQSGELFFPQTRHKNMARRGSGKGKAKGEEEKMDGRRRGEAAWRTWE